MADREGDFAHLIEGLEVDVSGPWTDWEWAGVRPVTSYEHACLEEYRDSVVVAYRLYNRIGLEHARRQPQDADLVTGSHRDEHGDTIRRVSGHRTTRIGASGSRTKSFEVKQLSSACGL